MRAQAGAIAAILLSMTVVLGIIMITYISARFQKSTNIMEEEIQKLSERGKEKLSIYAYKEGNQIYLNVINTGSNDIIINKVIMAIESSGATYYEEYMINVRLGPTERELIKLTISGDVKPEYGIIFTERGSSFLFNVNKKPGFDEIHIKKLIIRYLEPRAGHRWFVNYLAPEDEIIITNYPGTGTCAYAWTLGLQFRYGIFEFDGYVKGPPESGKFSLLFGLERVSGMPTYGLIYIGVDGSGKGILGVNPGGGAQTTTFKFSDQNWTNSYHHFKLFWNETKISLYVNGTLVYEVVNENLIPKVPMSIIMKVCQSNLTQTEGEVRVRYLIYMPISDSEIWQGDKKIWG